MKHMVMPVVAAAFFQGDQIFWSTDHADNLTVSPRILADTAGVKVRKVETLGTKVDLFFDLQDGLSQTFGVFLGSPQYVHGQSASRFFPHSREFAQFLD
jgi:hypothetical protein